MSESSLTGVTGSPKKKGLFKKPSSRPAAPSGGGFPVALSFTDDGTSALFIFFTNLMSCNYYFSSHL